MKRTLKVAVLVVGSAAGIALGGVGLLAYWVRDMCANSIVAEYGSPDGTAKVVVFERDCGATTGFSTQASLLAPNTQVTSGGGNLFVADTDHGRAPSGPQGGPEVRVRWDSSEAIVIGHDHRARVFKAEQRLGSVNVRYDVFR